MPLRALLYRRPSEPTAISIAFERQIYLVRVRRHRQARRYTLRIHSVTREVVLTMPPRGSLKQAREFAEKHGGWIAARLGRLPEPAPFAPGAVIPLRGVDHRIVHRRGQRGTVWIENGEASERLLCVAGAEPHVAFRVSNLLRGHPSRSSNCGWPMAGPSCSTGCTWTSATSAGTWRLGHPSRWPPPSARCSPRPPRSATTRCTSIGPTSSRPSTPPATTHNAKLQVIAALGAPYYAHAY